MLILNIDLVNTKDNISISKLVFKVLEVTKIFLNLKLLKFIQKLEEHIQHLNHIIQAIVKDNKFSQILLIVQL